MRSRHTYPPKSQRSMPSHLGYERIPSNPVLNDDDDDEEGSDTYAGYDDTTHLVDADRDPESSERGAYRLPTYPPDPRFHRPEPSPWARAGLLLFIVVMFWLAIQLRRWGVPKEASENGEGGMDLFEIWD